MTGAISMLLRRRSRSIPPWSSSLLAFDKRRHITGPATELATHIAPSSSLLKLPVWHHHQDDAKRRQYFSSFVPDAYRWPSRRHRAARSGETSASPARRARQNLKRGIAPHSKRTKRAKNDHTKAATTTKKESSSRMPEAQLLALQNECYRLARQYHETLFPNVSCPVRQGGPSEVETLAGAAEVVAVCESLHTAHGNLSSSDSTTTNTVDRINLVETEETFRHICLLLDRSIASIALGRYYMSRTSSVQPGDTPVEVAEQLLKELIQLRQDRSYLLEWASSSKTSTNEQKGGLVETVKTWIRDIFIVAPGEKKGQVEAVDDSTWMEQLVAHQDPNYGPSSETIRCVLRCYFFQYEEIEGRETESPKEAEGGKNDDLEQNGLSLELRLDRASRMTGLVDTLREVNLSPVESAYGLVFKAHEDVGTLKSALEAERLYHLFVEDTGAQSSRIFTPLLYAFQSAAANDKVQSNRGEAARKAEQILIQQEELSDSVKMFGTHYRVLLETYAKAGIDAVPDICERADFLMERLGSGRLLRQVIYFKPRTNISTDFLQRNNLFNLALLHNLVLIYAQSHKFKRLELAMNVLRCMAYLRDHSESQRGFHQNSYPNVDMYNAMLEALKGNWKLTGYTIEIFDQMTRSTASWPNQKTFEYILLGKDSRPEEWLSKLEIRRSCLPEADRKLVHVDASAYLWALGRLRHSARVKGSVDSAARCLRLLDRMEAQSGRTGMSTDPLGNLSDFEQEIVSSVYNERLRPTIEAYHLVLSACNYVTLPSEKEDAFAIAREIYDRIKSRDFADTQNTLRLFLWCCTNLVESQDVRRRHVQEVARQAFAAKQDFRGLSRVLYMNDLGHLLPRAHQKNILPGNALVLPGTSSARVTSAALDAAAEPVETTTTTPTSTAPVSKESISTSKLLKPEKVLALENKLAGLNGGSSAAPVATTTTTRASIAPVSKESNSPSTLLKPEKVHTLDMQLQSIENKLTELNGGSSFNVRSPKQVAHAVFGDQSKSTKKKLLLRAIETKSISVDQRKLASLVLEYRDLTVKKNSK